MMKTLFWTFVTPTMIESANVILKKHWAARHRYREALAKELYYLTLDAKRDFDLMMGNGKIAPDWKTRVLYVSYRMSQIDEDNLFAGTKSWTDTLVECGWARGDSPDLIKVRVGQLAVENKRLEQTVIRIEIY